MKIMSIAPACCYAKSKPQPNATFKGLPGGTTLEETNSSADYIDNDVIHRYYPFASETSEQIKDAEKRHMQNPNKYEGPGTIGRFTCSNKQVFKPMPALPFNKEQYSTYMHNPSELAWNTRLKIKGYVEEIEREKNISPKH